MGTGIAVDTCKFYPPLLIQTGHENGFAECAVYTSGIVSTSLIQILLTAVWE